MEVNVHHAKTHLSKLIAAVESGEEVIIARAGKPAVKLVLVTPPARKSRKHLRGSGIGKIWTGRRLRLRRDRTSPFRRCSKGDEDDLLYPERKPE